MRYNVIKGFNNNFRCIKTSLNSTFSCKECFKNYQAISYSAIRPSIFYPDLDSGKFFMKEPKLDTAISRKHSSNKIAYFKLKMSLLGRAQKQASSN